MATTYLQKAAVAVGNGQPLNVKHLDQAIGIEVVVPGVATILFEGAIEGSAWAAAEVTPAGASGSPVTSATASGIFRWDVAAFEQVRARISVWTSGATDAIATHKG